MFSKESLEWLPLMGGGIIQQHNDRAAQVPQQLTQKHTDLLLGDVVKEEQIVEAESVSFGAQRNSGDDGDFVAAPLAMTLEGVQPRGAQVLTTRGASKKPDSSAKTKWAPNRAAFFLPAASLFASNARWPVRSALKHVVRASGASTRAGGGVGPRC